jgi:SAM-dependent methyltransferase
MQNYSHVATHQHEFDSEWKGLRSFNNRVKSLIIQYVVLNAQEKGLGDGFLDMACGRGGDIAKWNASARIADSRITTWGIEVSKEAVAEAHRRVTQSNFRWCKFIPIHGDALCYKGEDEPSFAGVTLHFCLNYLWTQEVEGLITNLKKSMKPEAMLSIIFTNYDNLDNAPFDMVKKQTGTIYTFKLGNLVDDVPEYMVKMKVVINRFRAAGFKLMHRWDRLSDASVYLAPISRFLKPPLPMTDVELAVCRCYSACIFVS